METEVKPANATPEYMQNYDGFKGDWISTSALSLYLTCGHAFYLKYIERVKEPKSPRLMTGVAAHKARQVSLKHKLETGALVDEDTALEAARDSVVDQIDNNEVIKDKEFGGLSKKRLKGRAVDLAVAFAEVDWNIFQPKIKPLHVEKSFGLKHPNCRRLIVGTMDVVETGILINDLKNTKMKKNQIFADRNMGLSTYGLLAMANFKKMPKGYIIQNIINNKTGFNTQILYTGRTKDQLKMQLMRFVAASDGIDKGIFLPANPDHWKCSKGCCGYWSRCPFVTARTDHEEYDTHE